MTKPSYISDELFHFVGRLKPNDHDANYDTLLKILRMASIRYRVTDPSDTSEGGKVGYSFNFNGDFLKGDLIVPSVTCFCDIPLGALDIHIQKYGQFGLSFDRTFLIGKGARPVTYIPYYQGDSRSTHGRALIENIIQTCRAFYGQVVEEEGPGPHGRSFGGSPESPQETRSSMLDIAMRDFLAFLKPFDSELSATDPENFYLEREWRKYLHLLFEPEQVRTIVVEDSYVEDLRTKKPEYKNKICASSKLKEWHRES